MAYFLKNVSVVRLVEQKKKLLNFKGLLMKSGNYKAY